MKELKPPPGKRFGYTDGDPPRDDLIVCQLAFLHDVLMGDGDPTTGDLTIDQGPQVDQIQFDKVMNYINIGKEEGATAP